MSKRTWRHDVYYWLWLRTRFVRRLWCKHGVLTGGTATNFATICANCGSKDVPQMCGQRNP